MKLGILYERMRKDERLLREAARRQGVEVTLLDNNEFVFKLEGRKMQEDIILERCINHLSAMYSVAILENKKIAVINSSTAAEICGSKFLVTEALLKADIPTPKVSIAFSKETALEAVDKIGYPAVLKPAIGSWGKLLAKVNDREAAEAVLDHKAKLGTYHHSVFYIQKYVQKPNRDIRAFVVGDKVVGAVYRKSEHWITHLDKGAVLQRCDVDAEIEELALRSARAVKGAIVCVDMVERVQGLTVLEVDYTPEFSDYFPYLDPKIIDDVIAYLKGVAKR